MTRPLPEYFLANNTLNLRSFQTSPARLALATLPLGTIRTFLVIREICARTGSINIWNFPSNPLPLDLGHFVKLSSRTKYSLRFVLQAFSMSRGKLEI